MKISFKLCKDVSGREFIKLVKSPEDKNVKSSIIRKQFEFVKSTSMFSASENVNECPVEAIELYLSKLASTALFPKPCSSFENQWYSYKKVLGKRFFNGIYNKQYLYKKH